MIQRNGKISCILELEEYCQNVHTVGIPWWSILWEFPGGPVKDSMLSLLRAWVHSLVGELRSRKPRGWPKKSNKMSTRPEEIYRFNAIPIKIYP